MTSKTFERIYNKCRPLLSFKEIYFECNTKPLLKQILREMAAVTAKLFSTVLTNKINGKIEKWRSSTNQEIINEKQLNNEINNIVREIVERNDTTEKPFAIKNENTLLSYTEKYANILRLQYPEYAVLVNTSAINTWIDNVLENIINNNPNYLKAMLIDTTILNIIKTSFLEVYQNLPCFN